MKAYTTQGWLFANKDLAVICGNTSSPIEVEVPDNTELITGRIEIDEDDKNYCVLVPVLDNDKLDWTDLVDYTPLVEFWYDETRDDEDGTTRILDCFETKWLNFKMEHLSTEMQYKIQSKITQIMDSYESLY